MGFRLRKPILVVGIALSTGLWLWDSLAHTVTQVGELSLAGAIVVGGGLWLLQQKYQLPVSLLAPSTLDREIVTKEITKAQTIIDLIGTEAPEEDINDLKAKIQQLPNLTERQELQIAITGGRKVGKTTLKQYLERQTDIANISWLETQDLTPETALDTADLVVFVTTGDLTDSEWQIMQQLRQQHQRLMVVFNKQDLHIPEERATILQQLRQRVSEFVATEDAIAIAADPAEIKVRKHTVEGEIQERLEKPPAEISQLSDRLKTILSEERQQLVLATTWRTAVTLKTVAKEKLNRIRGDRALPIIERYQWLAAAAAFANPVAALDLLATAAINAQMLVDLGEVYQQKFSLSQAQAAATTLGKLMLKLGLVELSTQSIGGLLKSNAITYVAGGAVQGVSVAYLTRIAGLSLIEYFQEQEIATETGGKFNLERLQEKLQKVFQENQRIALLQNFVQQAVGRLSAKSPQLT